MLTLQQRPQAMASGRHLDPDSPTFFGYSIDDDFPFLQNAPDPAPGAPLLSDTEQNALNSWFDDMKSDDRIHDDMSGNAIHSENWIDIPQFVGSTTSFGPPQDSHHASLSHHVLSQDVFDNLPLMLTPGPMPPLRLIPQHIPPVIPSSARSNSSPAQPLHVPSGLGHPFSGLPGASIGIDQSPSDDVVAAANTLLLNGHHGTRHASFNYGHRLHLSQQHHGVGGLLLGSGAPQSIATSTTSPSALLPPAGHNAGPQPRAARLSATSGAPAHISNDLGTGQSSSLGFSAQGNTSQQAAFSPLAPTLHRHELQWGTDQSFAQKQFTPRSEKETSEALMNVHFKSMECLEPNHSASTTRPSSPAYDSSFAPLNLKTRTASFMGDAEAHGKPAMAPPRKRRKGKGTESEDADQTLDEDSAFAANGPAGEGNEDITATSTRITKTGKPRKRKAKATLNGHPPPQSSASPPNLLTAAEPSSADGAGADGTGLGSAPTKRRRSAAPLAKPPRENLTEEQKRENHIKSEQKRRTLIKTGFEDLCILVPGLQGGNLSKSLVLTTAAAWLTELLEGNKRLENELRYM